MGATANRSLAGQVRDAIFPEFSGITDFHKSKLSIKNLCLLRPGKNMPSIFHTDCTRSSIACQ